jgi:hypothetical protein
MGRIDKKEGALTGFSLLQPRLSFVFLTVEAEEPTERK